jgi:hypothetical protein
MLRRSSEDCPSKSASKLRGRRPGRWCTRWCRFRSDWGRIADRRRRSRTPPIRCPSRRGLLRRLRPRYRCRLPYRSRNQPLHPARHPPPCQRLSRADRRCSSPRSTNHPRSFRWTSFRSKTRRRSSSWSLLPGCPRSRRAGQSRSWGCCYRSQARRTLPGPPHPPLQPAAPNASSSSNPLMPPEAQSSPLPQIPTASPYRDGNSSGRRQRRFSRNADDIRRAHRTGNESDHAPAQ